MDNKKFNKIILTYKNNKKIDSVKFTFPDTCNLLYVDSCTQLFTYKKINTYSTFSFLVTSFNFMFSHAY